MSRETSPPIGGLNHRVQLLRRDTVIADDGGQVVTFVPLITLWARVTAVGARAGVTSDGTAVAITHTVVLRHRSGVGPGDRFSYQGRTLDIASAEDLTGRRRFLACRCNEARITG